MIPEAAPAPPDGSEPGRGLRGEALLAWRIAEPAAKAEAARALAARAEGAGDAAFTPDAVFSPPDAGPGRPQRPRVVPPSAVPRRTAFTPAGRAALLHAVAHIELNAIDLALDAAWRFAGLPVAYYRDWLRVAGEEALHFGLLQAHLATLGHAYGDFDAHAGLWSMCENTAGSALARMALVPRTLEARGLDATPPMRAKFAAAGDTVAAAILDRILADEVGHVAVGNRWFLHLCEAEGLEPLAAFESLRAGHGAPRPKPPFNLPARRAAGFSDRELRAWEQAVPPEDGARPG
jgi:uncharacterized ferritin-like protein (DUF455 family)